MRELAVMVAALCLGDAATAEGNSEEAA